MAGKRGGARPGAGRKPGVVAAVKMDLAKRARTHGAAALKTLAAIMEDEDAPHSARIAAANFLLDRGFGKPIQGHQIGGGGDHPLKIVITRFADDQPAQ